MSKIKRHNGLKVSIVEIPHYAQPNRYYKRVIELFDEFGLEKPSFESLEKGFLVTIFSKVTNRVTDNQIEILNLIKQNSKITTSMLSLKVGISQRKIKENISK